MHTPLTKTRKTTCHCSNNPLLTCVAESGHLTEVSTLVGLDTGTQAIAPVLDNADRSLEEKVSSERASDVLQYRVEYA